MIYIDDLGYADIGPFGATKQKTPNLDRMAQEGLKLTGFYAAPVAAENPEVVQRLETSATAMSGRIGGKQPSERRTAGVVENP
jgi:hypothetical protein